MKKKHAAAYIFGIVAVLLGAYTFFFSNAPTSPSSPLANQNPSPSSEQNTITGTTWNPGSQIKTSDCQINNSLPDSGCTPGAIFSNVTLAQICTPGYSTSVRNVPESEKSQAYAEYGITSHPTGSFEVDHLISLELGGSNDIANLWPEAASPKPGYHEKDKVENYLHDQVCSNKISLQQAQQEIATNWLSVYTSMPSQDK